MFVCSYEYTFEPLLNKETLMSNREKVWVGVIGGWMTTLFEVVVSSNLVDLAVLMDCSYGTLKRSAKDYRGGHFFVKRRKDGIMWTVTRVDLVRVKGRGGKRVPGQSKMG